MKLKDFIEKFIGRNSLIRLWTFNGNEKVMIAKYDISKPGSIDEVVMDWELLSGRNWRSKYLYHDVIYVKDILCTDSFYKEAVNIVISDR